MSFASHRPLLDGRASPVLLPPALNAGALARSRARVPAADTLAAMLAGRQGRGWQRGLALAEGAAAPGLQLVPAAGFRWSGPHGRPRTRGGHVLVRLTGGEAVLRLPRTGAVASPLTFLPAGTAFAWESSADVEGTVLLLTRNLAAEAATPFPTNVIRTTPRAPAGGGLDGILAELNRAAREDRTSEALRIQLGRLARRLWGMAAGTGDDPLATRFIALAARELPHGRGIADLAAAMGCTTALLDSACIARHGQRAADLLLSLRVNRAVELLKVTPLPLAEVAREAGFAGADCMAEAVTAATGRIPEALRLPASRSTA